MKTYLKIFLCGVAFALVLAVRADEAAAKPDAVKIKQGANGETILTLDEATQTRLGLVVTNPAATDWQPEIKATGRVLDLSPLMDLLISLHQAESSFDAAHRELERGALLGKDRNISQRALQELETTYRQNGDAVGAVYLKIQAGWGKRIAEMTGPIVIESGAERKQDPFLNKLPEDCLLIRVDLPAGRRLEATNQTAKVISLYKSVSPVIADYFDILPTIDTQTQQEGILFVVDRSSVNRLMPGETVTAFIKSGEAPVSGITIPASAILRHDGKGWVFVQTGATDFSRREISLDRAVDGGFFSADFSATNRVVVTGAQTVLSAELSGGGFQAGLRD